MVVGSSRKRTRAQFVPFRRTFNSQGTQTQGTTAVFRRANRRFAAGPKKSGTLRQQVSSLQRVVRKILPEVKNASIDLGQTNITTAGTVTHLTAITQGIGEDQRIGEDVTLTGIIIKGFFTSVDATPPTTTGSYYRFALICDKQQVGDTSATISTAFSSTNPVLALPSISFNDRYRYLWVSPLMAGWRITTGNQFPVCNHSWKGSIRVGFNGTASTDITKNGCYFVILTNDGANVLDFTGSARVSYTDS